MEEEREGAPCLPLPVLFSRFFCFGCLAFGGPVAQIGRLRHELVDRERWVSPDRFKRVLAVYQALPGPEATELCVYFGMLSRGRLGGLLAGLGFILPGFLLVLGAAMILGGGGGRMPLVLAALAGAQPAVVAMVLRGAARIGQGVLLSPWLWTIAAVAGLSEFLGAPFFIPILAGALAWPLARRRAHLAAVLTLGLATALIVLLALPMGSEPHATLAAANGSGSPTKTGLFTTGLRGGLLTFGGAYTAIPFVRGDVVVNGGWLTDQQFLDSLAISSVFPAPLVMFVAYVGCLIMSWPGAVLMTVGMFLPAFCFTLLGHSVLERIIDNERIHAALDGIAAAVVGLMAVTAVQLTQRAVNGWTPAIILVGGLAALWLWRNAWATPVVVTGGALIGILSALS
ncbi:MAG: chromate efflux transporter [Fimbriimonadaceae bacterium]